MQGRDIKKDINTVVKDFDGAALRIGLICPTEYIAGKSHLALQILYHVAHEFPHVACERIFLPPLPERRSGAPPRSRETGRTLRKFDLLATSLSFELEYPWFLWMLQQAKIPPLLRDRHPTGTRHPFLLLGGLAISANPAPLRQVADAIFAGEADFAFYTIIETCLATPRVDWGGKNGLGKLEGILLPGQTEQVHRVWVSSLDPAPYPTAQVLPPISQPTEWGKRFSPLPNSFLLEINRGCPNWCRFCLAGHFTRPFRSRSFSVLRSILEAGVSATPTTHVTLIGSAVADYPDLKPLLQFICDMDLKFSLPSVRLDQVDDDLLALLRQNGTRTLTIAPEAASEVVRRAAGKAWSNAEIADVVLRVTSAGIRKLKFYFLLGLPNTLAEETKEIPAFMTRITSDTPSNNTFEVSVNPFVPKAHTPLAQCVEYYIGENFGALNRAWRVVIKQLRKIPRVRPEGYDPRWARIQTLLSLTGEDIAPLLVAWAEKGITLGRWTSVLREYDWDLNAKLTQMGNDPVPPWLIVDTGVHSDVLSSEREAAEAGRVTPTCHEGCRRCGLCP